MRIETYNSFSQLEVHYDVFQDAFIIIDYYVIVSSPKCPKMLNREYSARAPKFRRQL